MVSWSIDQLLQAETYRLRLEDVHVSSDLQIFLFLQWRKFKLTIINNNSKVPRVTILLEKWSKLYYYYNLNSVYNEKNMFNLFYLGLIFTKIPPQAKRSLARCLSYADCIIIGSTSQEFKACLIKHS